MAWPFIKYYINIIKLPVRLVIYCCCFVFLHQTELLYSSKVLILIMKPICLISLWTLCMTTFVSRFEHFSPTLLSYFEVDTVVVVPPFQPKAR